MNFPVGQAAYKKKPIIVSKVPDDYLKITSGIGEIAPKNIIVAPLLFEGDVKGVIELGSFKQLSDFDLIFLVLVNIVWVMPICPQSRIL